MTCAQDSLDFHPLSEYTGVDTMNQRNLALLSSSFTHPQVGHLHDAHTLTIVALSKGLSSLYYWEPSG